MRFNVYAKNDKKARASCEHAEEAACLVAFLGEGALIKSGYAILWTEGSERQPAAESYDHVADVCNERWDRMTADQKT